jgi:hypothetical protein
MMVVSMRKGLRILPPSEVKLLERLNFVRGVLMTPANISKLKGLAIALKKLAEENGNAQTAMYVILGTQQELARVAMDLHFRPEANS